MSSTGAWAAVSGPGLDASHTLRTCSQLTEVLVTFYRILEFVAYDTRKRHRVQRISAQICMLVDGVAGHMSRVHGLLLSAHIAAGLEGSADVERTLPGCFTLL